MKVINREKTEFSFTNVDQFPKMLLVNYLKYLLPNLQSGHTGRSVFQRLWNEALLSPCDTPKRERISFQLTNANLLFIVRPASIKSINSQSICPQTLPRMKYFLLVLKSYLEYTCIQSLTNLHFHKQNNFNSPKQYNFWLLKFQHIFIT